MNLTPGKYQCIVLAPGNGWIFESKEKRTPYVGLSLQVTSGPHKGEEVEYSAWLSDGAVERTMKNLTEVFGWDGDLEKLARQVDVGHFVGKPCSITVEEEMYKDKPRNVVKWLNSSDSKGSVMDANRALQLARRLSGKPDTGPAGPPPERRRQPEPEQEQHAPGVELDENGDPRW